MMKYFLSTWLLVEITHGLLPPPIDCATVRCAFPICGPDEQLFIPKLACCPICIPKPDIVPDCRAVLCPQPICGPGEEEYTPKGQCCSRCVSEGDKCGLPGTNCDALLAPALLCPDGESCYGNCGTCVYVKDQETGKLECSALTPEYLCPLDCSKVLCARPICTTYEELFVAEGQCCPICVPKPKPDCRAVLCPQPICGPGEVEYTPKGECCSRCVTEGDKCGLPGTDCPALRTAAFLCPDGKTCYGNCGPCVYVKDQQTGKAECSALTPEYLCPPDCSKINCMPPLCSPYEEFFYPDGQCCPICRPKKNPCFGIICALPLCGPGEELYTPVGKCCPTCRRKKLDCRVVLCIAAECFPGEEEYIPKGGCCPKCRPTTLFCIKDAMQCPDGSYVGRDSDNGCKFFPCPDDETECKKKQCMDGTGQCVDGSIVNCKRAPCSIDNGECKPGQLCSNNYCNGCNAVCSKCPTKGYCIDGLNNCVPGGIFNCLIDPCSIKNGGCGEESECWSNYCNGCNAICKPKCNDLQCRNSNGECKSKTCIQDPCNHFKNPCPGQLCSADTCSNPVCQARCSKCPSEGYCVDVNDRCVVDEGIKCAVNPCDRDNGGCGSQKCTSNYCNGCNAVCTP